MPSISHFTPRSRPVSPSTRHVTPRAARFPPEQNSIAIAGAAVSATATAIIAFIFPAAFASSHPTLLNVLGGFLRNVKHPSWTVHSVGLERLLTIEVMWPRGTLQVGHVWERAVRSCPQGCALLIGHWSPMGRAEFPDAALLGISAVGARGGFCAGRAARSFAVSIATLLCALLERSWC